MSDQLTRLNDALEGRYRVDKQLGEGGMATVYLAKDLRHNRSVALKVLKPELASALGADRFLAEIETTANLQHPQILPLFDSGEADGLLFYTMPYLEGETLRQRLERERRLPIEEAVRIVTEVAEALQVAHEQGVVHRDIKPSNILLTRGKAMVADFGIALAAALSERTRLTQTGSSVGTAGYMSPEQASGDRAVDHRADIYSLGCVLFELLAGEPPFGGATLMSVLAKQLTAAVPSVRAIRPEVSATLDRTVATALAKEPAHRFQSASAFASALTLPEEAARPGPERGNVVVVVLPFVNRSADPDNEYFSDGLTDEVIADLSVISALQVISRNSSMALKGTTKDTRTLARELGVTHLVTGTVRRAGNALRVTAELVDVATDAPIWSEKLSGTAEDVFGIQEEISRQIVSALKVRLTDTEKREVADRPIDNPVAYDCYLRACQLMYNWTPEGQRRALRLVEEAIGIVGGSPLLLAMMGQLHWNTVNMNLASREEALALASDFVTQALALDPVSSHAIFVRGLVAGMRGQSEAALIDLYRAHQRRPGDSNVLIEMIRFSHASGLGHHRKYVERQVQIDPLSPVANLCAAMYPWLYGPHSAAAPPARRAIQLAPEPSMLHLTASWAIAEAGFRDEAIGILGRAAAATADTVLGPQALFLKCALEGNEGGALGIMTSERENQVRNEMLCRIIADAYALLGRNADALRWLRAAVEYGFINYPNLSVHDTFIESLRGEPEFGALMAEVKPRWEAVVAWERGMQK